MCRGSLIGHPVENIRIVLTDGAAHTVDSSELAFKMASIYAFRQVYLYKAEATIYLFLLMFIRRQSLFHQGPRPLLFRMILVFN